MRERDSHPTRVSLITYRRGRYWRKAKRRKRKSTNTTAETSTTTECVETLLATSPFGPSNLALTTARSPDLTTFRLSLGLQYLSAIRNLEPQTTGPARSQEAL